MDILADPEIEVLAKEARYTQAQTQNLADRMEQHGKTQKDLKAFLKKKTTLMTPEYLEKIERVAEEAQKHLDEETEAMAEQRDKEEAEAIGKEREKEEARERRGFVSVFKYPSGTLWQTIFDESGFLPDNLIVGDVETLPKKAIDKRRFYNKLQTGPTKYFVVDLGKNVCEIVQVSKTKLENGIEEWMEIRKVKQGFFSISDLKMYPAIPELKSFPMYSFVLNEKRGKSRRINPCVIEECTSKIGSLGLFTSSRKALDTTSGAINCLINCEEFKEETKPPYPGFFIIGSKLVSTREFKKLPTKKQINAALEWVEQFGEEYGDFKGVFSYMVRWQIAGPFNYALKQKHPKNLLKTMPNILLFGKTRLGKDTVANFGSFIWRRHFYSSSGARIHSPAQFGEAISKSSLPVVVSEAETLWQNDKIMNAIKEATETTTAREIKIRMVQHEVPSLSPMILTSNYGTPDKDAAQGSRINLFNYQTGNIRSVDEMKAFNNRFKPQDLEGPLSFVGFVGDYVGYEILNNPQRLDGEWFLVADDILKDIYKYAGRKMPGWLKDPEMPQGIEEADEREREFYISNILGYIIKNSRIEQKREPLKDENGNPVEDEEGNIQYTEDKVPVTPRKKAEDVILNAREPWIHYREIKGGKKQNRGKFVFISKDIEKDLDKNLDIPVNLEIIADLLGGVYERRNETFGHRFYAIFDYKHFLNLYGEDEVIVDETKDGEE
jgi:hypothetical protein